MYPVLLYLTNSRKHGVSFYEAREIFGDELSLTVPDPDHSINEDRFLILVDSYLAGILLYRILKEVAEFG